MAQITHLIIWTGCGTHAAVRKGRRREEGIGGDTLIDRCVPRRMFFFFTGGGSLISEWPNHQHKIGMGESLVHMVVMVVVGPQSCNPRLFFFCHAVQFLCIHSESLVYWPSMLTSVV
jgi:hypothetical protein